MVLWIGWQDQGGGMRRIAALFGHSDNAEHAIRDQANRPSLSLSGSLHGLGHASSSGALHMHDSRRFERVFGNRRFACGCWGCSASSSSLLPGTAELQLGPCGSSVSDHVATRLVTSDCLRPSASSSSGLAGCDLCVVFIFDLGSS